MRVSKFNRCLLVLGCMSLLGGQVRLVAYATNAIVVCDPGYITSSSPIQGIPTYDYGTDGLVRFHFVLDGNGWTPTNNNVVVHGANCEYLYAKGYTYASSGNIPAGITHLMVKAQETSPGSGWYVFSAYDEDKNEPVGLGGMPTQVNEPFVGFAILQNPSYGVNYGAKSPIVPVKDPTKIVLGKKPILIIPGTLGTEIWKEKEKIWMDIDRMIAPYDFDTFIGALAYQGDGAPLDTSLSLGEVLGKPHETFDYSDKLVQDLISAGYTLNKDLFLFPYDWREHIEKNAETALKEKIDNILASTNINSVDVIAHSQGGLVIKRLLFEIPEYKDKVNKIVFVGTPNLGAPKTAKILFYGDDLGVRKANVSLLNPLEIKNISQNMPSIYEMLPSREYFNHTDGYLGVYNYTYDSNSGGVKATYDDTKSTLKSPWYHLNSSLLDEADTFHSREFDNFSFENSGIKAFNIIGCESDTIGKIYINGSGGKNDIVNVPGDGTVPLVSASNIGGAKNYYVRNKNQIHGTMLTVEGVRQQIVDIITDKNTLEAGLTTNPGLCEYRGKVVKVHSPVDMHVYDGPNHHTGPTSAGSIEYGIEGVSYYVLGHDKFAFLPDSQPYTVKLVGTDSGTFGLDIQEVNSTVGDTTHFDSVPVVTGAIAELSVKSGMANEIKLDREGDGQFEKTISPSSILNALESQDPLPPVSTSTLSGTMGQPGFYRGDVVVALNATDTIVSGLEVQTSGVLGIKYSLDANSSDLSYSSYQSYVGPITVSTEGSHTLSFYSVDRAGNREEVKTITFTIDKSAPEVSLQFDQKVKDLVFSGIDNLPVTVSDKDDLITITDQAGNTTVLKLKDKNRKRSLKAEIKSISYNGQVADLSKNGMVFSWGFDRKDKDKLVLLSQIVAAKKDYLISAIYNGKTTMLIGRDASGKIKKTLPGLTLLKLTTSRGDLNWSY